MRRPWDAPIRQLRRRALFAGAVATTGRWLVPGALPVVGFLVLTRWSPWARILAPYLGIAAGALVIVLLLVGAVRARRSQVYFAKGIDLANRLDDRLASAVDWDRQKTRDGFQSTCIEHLSLELGARRTPLVLPSVRPRRVPLVIAAAVVCAGAAVIYFRQPAAVFENDARQKVAVAKPLAEAARAQLTLLKAQPPSDPALEQMAVDLAALVDSLSTGQLDRETSLADLERLRERIAQHRAAGNLRELGRSGAPGPIGALARALGVGDGGQAKDALAALVQQLTAGALTDGELARLKPLLDAMSSLAEEPLAHQLSEASRLMDAGDQAAAAARLTEALANFTKLDKPLRAVAAVAKMEQALAALEQGVHRTGDSPAGADDKPGGTVDDHPPTAGAPGQQPGGGGGAGSDVATSHGPAQPIPGRHGGEFQVAGVWNGKVLRQLFDTSQGGGPDAEAKRILVDHQRVVEDRFRHDDVPREYQDAVRAYFAALHRE